MVSRIAIFRALYLGDMLCIIPTVRAVRKAYPRAEVFLVGLPWQKDFVSRFAHYFDEFIEFPGWPGLPEQALNTERILKFLNEIHRYEFDLILQMQGNGAITNTLCMLWNGRKVCGLRRNGEYCPDEGLFPISEDGEHEVLRFLKLADALGIPRQGTHLEFPVTEAEKSSFQKLVKMRALERDEYICIHSGARDVRRRWPVENFALIASEMTADGYTVVLTGSLEEESLLNELQNKISGNVINTVETFGHHTAGELACIIKNSRLIVSNDTGVSHIAAAVRVPSVILFSAYSDINRWRPLDGERHLAIESEQAQNTAYVLQCIKNKLQAQNNTNVDAMPII